MFISLGTLTLGAEGEPNQPIIAMKHQSTPYSGKVGDGYVWQRWMLAIAWQKRLVNK